MKTYKILTTCIVPYEYIIRANNEEEAKKMFQAGEWESTKETMACIDSQEEIVIIEEEGK